MEFCDRLTNAFACAAVAGGKPDNDTSSTVRLSGTRLLNAQIGARLSHQSELVLDAFNLFNAQASDIDYFYVTARGRAVCGCRGRCTRTRRCRGRCASGSSGHR